jgi:UDP-N-acetylmuramyl pentapeptide phosphotransferase/UDP-N-acetylglucosamine-1-phosphate transferase
MTARRPTCQKAGTPTMGGALIIVAIVIATLLWADLGQPLRLDRARRDRCCSALVGFSTTTSSSW